MFERIGSAMVRRMHSSFLSSFPLAVVMIVACDHPAARSDSTPTDSSVIDAVAIAPWRIPVGWTPEVIAFPLPFALALEHHGVEELRFPPGVFELFSTNYWSYAFVWRIDDSATLDAVQLGAELTTYYRGLLTSVDSQHLITSPEAIVADATAVGSGFAFTAHLFDAFNQAQPVDVVGLARRMPCGAGAVWAFDLSPKTCALQLVRAELDELAGEAMCGQLVPVR